MPSRYSARFKQLKEKGGKAYIPFTMLGWPSRDQSLTIIKQMIDSGATALELGIAFSDPIADGPIIQQAATETLASGFTLSDALSLIKEVRSLNSEIPIGVLMYYNMILSQGVNEFFSKAHGAGVDSVLIADLPPESASEVAPQAKAHGIDLIYLVSPVTTEARIDTILTQATGFIYLVSRLGVTGIQTRSDTKDAALSGLIQKIKGVTQIPICAGFGISSAEDASKMIALGADGVITGSKVVELIQHNKSTLASEKLGRYYKEMIEAVNQFRSPSELKA